MSKAKGQSNNAEVKVPARISDERYAQLCKAIKSKAVQNGVGLMFCSVLDKSKPIPAILAVVSLPMVSALRITITRQYRSIGNGTGLSMEKIEQMYKEIKDLFEWLKPEVEGYAPKSAAKTPFTKALRAEGVVKVFLEFVESPGKGKPAAATSSIESPWKAKSKSESSKQKHEAS